MEDNTQRIIKKTEKPNSWEVGKVGNRFKLFFEDADDLKKMVEDLESKGFNVQEKEIDFEDPNTKFKFNPNNRLKGGEKK